MQCIKIACRWAVQMATEVLDMHRELERLRAECEELREYRDRYIQELNNGIAHNEHMLCGFLELAMKPGVMEAVKAEQLK